MNRSTPLSLSTLVALLLLLLVSTSVSLGAFIPNSTTQGLGLETRNPLFSKDPLPRAGDLYREVTDVVLLTLTRTNNDQSVQIKRQKSNGRFSVLVVDHHPRMMACIPWADLDIMVLTEKNDAYIQVPASLVTADKEFKDQYFSKGKFTGSSLPAANRVPRIVNGQTVKEKGKQVPWVARTDLKRLEKALETAAGNFESKLTQGGLAYPG